LLWLFLGVIHIWDELCVYRYCVFPPGTLKRHCCSHRKLNSKYVHLNQRLRMACKYIYTYMYIYIHIYTYIHVYTYIHIYIYTYIHVYIYIHTYIDI
jgi:hypothetical protein